MDPITLSILIGGGIALASGVGQGVGAANAAASQKDSAQAALDFQREMWEQQRSDQAPWLQAGQASLGKLLNFDPASFVNDPAYQFRLGEGQKALERSAAARGGLASGGFMRGLSRYSQGLASEEYGNQWNRLASLANVGQTSAQNLGALGAQYGNQASNLYGDIGNANAAGAVGASNAFTNTLGNLGGVGMYGLSRIPTQGGMGAYGVANPATTMINPATLPAYG